ncbi:MAG TPA: hypothetical protein VLG38_06860, partial [Gammaproteobacteria bacterium]|nr:hypothetical protein [Gammaproteobacteria bacterium]
LAYNPITAVPRTVVFNPLSVTMQRWHPCAMKLTTPIEATPSCAKNRQDYQEYVQTRKASRVGWTKEDTQAVAQEWQTAMYSNHAASAASAAASTTNDEDLGFDFNGWANSPARPKPAVLPSDEDLGFDFAGWGNSPVPVATTATTTTSAAISPADAISALSINQTPSSTATSLARRLFQT